MTRILVTGARDFAYPEVTRATLEVAHQLLAMPKDVVLVHGAARGLDTAAEQAGRSLGWAIEAYPAYWKTHGGCRCKDTSNRCGFAGYRRNNEMIELGADLVIAFPMHTEANTAGSRGTWHCAKAAVEAGLPVLVLWDGNLFPYEPKARELLSTHAKRVGLTAGSHAEVSLKDALIPV